MTPRRQSPPGFCFSFTPHAFCSLCPRTKELSISPRRSYAGLSVYASCKGQSDYIQALTTTLARLAWPVHLRVHRRIQLRSLRRDQLDNGRTKHWPLRDLSTVREDRLDWVKTRLMQTLQLNHRRMPSINPRLLLLLL